MPPAIIGAGIAAAGGLASASISSKASKKASKAATTAAADNNALAREQYSLNSANLSPYIQRGNAAGDTVNSLLGIGNDPTAAKAAFDQYQGSTGYQFARNEGLGAVNSNAYARGLGDSGATLKALQERGSGIAAQSFNNYLGQLTGQQNTGLTGANALAGVGTNLVGQVSANNNSAATATGNAALANAGQTNGTIQNLLNAGAYAYGSSYGGGSGASGIINDYGKGGLPGYGGGYVPTYGTYR